MASNDQFKGNALCQRCGSHPATVFVSKVVNGQKTDHYLCERCAKEEGAFHIMLPTPFTVHHMLGGLVGGSGPSRTGRGMENQARCPHCGQSYQEFATSGRLGCPACYQAFAGELGPLIRRVQAGPEHRGKVPLRAGDALRAERELDALREALREAIAREEFERAAELRDHIRELEPGHMPNGGGESHGTDL